MARPRTFEESAVVDAAQERFRSTGYAATSLDDLVRATGLAKGSLYNAFGDKHTLYLRAFESYCAGIVAALAGRLDGPDEGAAARLRAVLDGVACGEGGEGAVLVPQGCFLMKATAELGALDEEVAAIARRTFGELEEVLERTAAAARRAGDLRGPRDPRSVARQVLVVLRGIEALAAGGVERAGLREVAAQLGREIVGPEAGAGRAADPGP